VPKPMSYQAPWWLPGGNLQTIYAALRSRRYLAEAPRFRRERWITPDDDFVDVDFAQHPAVQGGSLGAGFTAGPPPGETAPSGGSEPHAVGSVGAGFTAGPPPGETAPSGGSEPHAVGSVGAQPLLVVFHGLEGSSASHYAEAFADVARVRGWACAVPHFRGCSGELNRAPRVYHSGDFEEIDWILRRFQREHAGPVVAVGISLGGNALMRWAGEMGAEAGQVVRAVASVCSPLDLASSGRAIGQGFNRLVYTRMFLNSMVPKALRKLEQHPGLFSAEALLAARDLYAFDNVVTAPLHGFRNTEDYWERASAKPHMRRIAVAALALNALNDPFVPASGLPRAADVSPAVTLWQPRQGGHVGFPSAPFPGHVRLMPEAVCGFFAAQL
jgi:predicted alpha/beta-fold hydrolase